MMQRELIDKYFRNECSDDERRQVLEYFRNNPEEWNRYLNEEDWDDFIVNEDLAPGHSAALFKEVSKRTFRKPGRSTLVWLAAATVACLLIASFWRYLAVRETPGQTTIANTGKNGQLTEKKNDTHVAMRVQLADGSTVLLAPGSYIRYYEPFLASHGRTVHLWGKALFDITKDNSRPFTVNADMLATTVLGTSFTVESVAESTFIKVKLHEGKVQVAAADTIAQTWNGKEVLFPGDELIYNKTTMLASVKRHVAAEQLVRAAPALDKTHSVRRPDSYTFDISPLSEVFDQLSIYYQVEIYYYPSEIKNKYFSGKMHKTDTLSTILNDIAILNQLVIEKNQDRYIIRKKN
ncbi:FecR family protein [Chitinophaga agri]|uniref:DUF4974 domain-containing protein n=1 Tax=Chitinophaga agri TaxID=2703787 RepID=A0A6B9ZPS8_9BACT|nr:FecR family protein [Chitinophaga agri]QHS63454.1 DUF4974 domain-containing protein [Chitinophaga agri]